jgi:hypothetical protein
MSTRNYLTHILSGGGDVQFSRPGFKIACQFNTGGSGQSMNYAGYAHYRSVGMRVLWNYYDTSTFINPTAGANGIHFLSTDTYTGGGQWASVHEVWPIMDMLYTDLETSLPFHASDANDVVVTAGNGGVSGTTLTVTAGGISSITRGARLFGTGIAANTWVTAFTNPTITMSPANAVADGTSVTVSGRIRDVTDLRNAIDAQMAIEMAANPGVTKILGAYSNTPAGIESTGSYLFWNYDKSVYEGMQINNNVCGQYVAAKNDFMVPEFYTSRMDDISVKAQWLVSEKNRLSLPIKIFPLFWPTAGTSEMSYETAMTNLEYLIRIPEIDGVAYWAVNGTHVPSKTSPWYDDGTFPWITAIQDFITKYGLSV